LPRTASPQERDLFLGSVRFILEIVFPQKDRP
jgi:hypothetical protein